MSVLSPKPCAARSASGSCAHSARVRSCPWGYAGSAVAARCGDLVTREVRSLRAWRALVWSDAGVLWEFRGSRKENLKAVFLRCRRVARRRYCS